MNVSSYVLMGIGVFIASAAQILLKKSARIKRERVLQEYMNRLVIGGYAILIVSMCIAIIAYREVPLKYGAIIESLGYVFVMVLSALFLKERITGKKLIGNLLIIAGVVVFSLQIF